MKNHVGQPILAAAAFQAAFSKLRASLAEGTVGGFSTLSGCSIRPCLRALEFPAL
jgi:fluoride ion exporter CrcB/FEX